MAISHKELFDYGMKLAAHTARRPLPTSTVKRVDISSAVRTLALMVAPADHAGIWAVAESNPNRPSLKPAILVSADPTSFEGMHHLWEKLGERWEPWLKTCYAQQVLPQLVVADMAAIDKLTWSARRIATHPRTSDKAKVATHYILTAAHLYAQAGAQALVPITQVIREHYITGADSADEIHLGHWLSYPERPDNWDRPQTGIDPAFEAETTRFGKAADKLYAAEGDSRIARGARITPLLTPELTRRHQDILAGLKLYVAHPGQVLEQAQKNAKAELRTLERFFNSGSRPSHRSISARVATLADRERSVEQWQKHLWVHDALSRQYGVFSGDVLAGTVKGNTITVPGVVRARVGDVFEATEGKVQVVDLHVESDTGATVVEFDAELGSGDDLLCPEIGSAAPGHWVSVGWAHDASLPTPPSMDLSRVSASSEGSLVGLAESLKG